MSRKTLFLGAAAVALAMSTGPATANHSWSNYHWAHQTGGALSVKVNYSVDSVWLPYVQTSIADWDNPVVGGAPDVLTLPSAASSADRRRCNPISGQILVCNYAYGRKGWLGIASVWADGNSHITQATTKLNDSYYGATSSYNTPGFRALVACQEVGHDFGLAHQDENFSNANLGSCMDYTNNPDGGGSNGTKGNRKPNAHDYEQLGTIYAHADSYSTATLAAAATNFGERAVGKPAAAGRPTEGAGDTAAEWGEPVHRDGKGRPDQFIRYYPGGYKMITHVFWAPDAKGNEAV
ncbi:hypothetical protein [Sphingomonas astaxanthinifaciens]|uniref:Metallo-peptidase family M12B Reprolysin-like n=1 Tax=Sphingomonas astaxanthinifaciens DSM 22298 TaxID=1123267 RepID=A0ABQ5Z589_9SPHN|nr:hypothetical protein [Sphingomonas astaxanthinifaciens]GLR47181.1 hypothetical protein GCM10007925_08920 [Sphingomonas astaxanthinifaciens DSM 22298]